MTDHVARLYAIALAVAVFCLTWAVVAARPWAAEASAKDARIVKLERREQRLRRESIRVKRLVERRFAAYRVRLRERQADIAAVNSANAAAAAAATAAASAAPSFSASAGSSGPSGASGSSGPSAPSVGVVSLPPVTSTSSS